MSDSRTLVTPKNLNVVLKCRKDNGNSVSKEIHKFNETVGYHQWVVVTMRHDISCTIYKPSKYSANRSSIHEKALKQLKQYIKYTVDYKQVLYDLKRHGFNKQRSTVSVSQMINLAKVQLLEY